MGINPGKTAATAAETIAALLVAGKLLAERLAEFSQQVAAAEARLLASRN